MHYVKFPTLASYIRVRIKVEKVPSIDLIRKVYASKRLSYMNAFKKIESNNMKVDVMPVGKTWMNLARKMGVL